MARALTAEQRERIRAQLSAASGYICPDCLPVLAFEPTADRWRFVVDHSVGCASYAERVLRAVVADPEADDKLMRDLGIDKPPTAEEMQRWQAWADMTDAEFEAEEGITP